MWLNQIAFQVFSEERDISKAGCLGIKLSEIFSPGYLSKESLQVLEKEAVRMAVVVQETSF